MPSRPAKPPHVLIVDDDRDIAELLQCVLIDEGYRVSCLYQDLAPETLAHALQRLAPQCVLLDGGGGADYSESWIRAQAVSASDTPVPIVMLTAHLQDATEARAGASARARAADFAAVVSKPFQLDELLTAVGAAVERGESRVARRAADAAQTAEMAERAAAAGARDIGRSSRRCWIEFRTPRGDLFQLYRWDLLGVYFLGRYADDGRLEPSGQFVDLGAAIAMALQPPAQ